MTQNKYTYQKNYRAETLQYRQKGDMFAVKCCLSSNWLIYWVIAVENTVTRANAFNLSNPAIVVNGRAGEWNK